MEQKGSAHANFETRLRRQSGKQCASPLRRDTQRLFFSSWERLTSEELIGKTLFLSCGALDGVETWSGQGLQGFVAVIIHVDLPCNSAASGRVAITKASE